MVKKTNHRHVKTSDIPPPYRRYTLHYVHQVIVKGNGWSDTMPRKESLDFKTLKEAQEYLSIAGENAYIVDNVTNRQIL